MPVTSVSLKLHDGSLHECCDAGVPCENFYAKFASDFTTVALLLRHNGTIFVAAGSQISMVSSAYVAICFVKNVSVSHWRCHALRSSKLEMLLSSLCPCLWQDVIVSLFHFNFELSDQFGHTMCVPADWQHLYRQLW